MSRTHPLEKGWLAYYRRLIRGWAKGNSLPHDAEDAAQEAAVNFLDKNPAVVLDQQAYLYRSARNRLLNEIRRQARHECVPLEALAETNHPWLVDPEVSLRAGQLANALEAALAQLPLKKRQVFIYHRLEGYTHPEIARKMGLAQSTVERYVMETTRHLRDQLQDFCPE